MKPGDNQYLGDGAYLHFDGHGFEFRANHHQHPTDRVYIELRSIPTLLRLIQETCTINGTDPRADQKDQT